MGKIWQVDRKRVLPKDGFPDRTGKLLGDFTGDLSRGTQACATWEESIWRSRFLGEKGWARLQLIRDRPCVLVGAGATHVGAVAVDAQGPGVVGPLSVPSNLADERQGML